MFSSSPTARTVTDTDAGIARLDLVQAWRKELFDLFLGEHLEREESFPVGIVVNHLVLFERTIMVEYAMRVVRDYVSDNAYVLRLAHPADEADEHHLYRFDAQGRLYSAILPDNGETLFFDHQEEADQARVKGRMIDAAASATDLDRATMRAQLAEYTRCARMFMVPAISRILEIVQD